MKYFFLSVVMLSVVVGCSNSTAEEPTAKKTDTVVTNQPVTTITPPVSSAIAALPSLQIINTDNQSFNLSQFRGKKVFVNLWATWCPPCRAEIPSIENLASKTDRSKVEFVMLSLDDDFIKAKIYAANNKMKLPVYYPTGNLPQLFNVEGIPTTFIFNENGEIIYEHTGGLDYDTKEFAELLNK
jgi:thiol-disulfide isomerase/thioredoxin